MTKRSDEAGADPLTTDQSKDQDASDVRSAHVPAFTAYNLRHLRVFLEVLDSTSVTRTAKTYNLSQSAVTQAVGKIEAAAGLLLFRRSAQGLFANEAGLVLGRRVRRALQRLDAATDAISPRLRLTATNSQLRALIAVSEAENFTLAAGRLGVTPSSVHRAISEIEGTAGAALFENTANGLIATRACCALSGATRLAFAELDQAAMELAEFTGQEVGRIVVGAMPLTQAAVLPSAIARFREARPLLPLRIKDAPYGQLLTELRRGEIDFLVGALRSPLPIGDVIQTPLFQDDHVIVAGPNHPLVGRRDLLISDLQSYPYVVNELGTPIRASFEVFCRNSGLPFPISIVESSSLLLTRELLAVTDHLGWVSRVRAATEIAHGLLVALDVPRVGLVTPIGLTTRSDWLPTPAQQAFVDCVTAIATCIEVQD